MPQCRPFFEPVEPRQSGLRRILVLGALVVAHVMSSTTVQAQCSSSSNPAPRPSVQANFSNQSFGTNPPPMPYGVGSFGVPGCAGSDGGDNENGGKGSPGQ